MCDRTCRSEERLTIFELDHPNQSRSNNGLVASFGRHLNDIMYIPRCRISSCVNNNYLFPYVYQCRKRIIQCVYGSLFSRRFYLRTCVQQVSWNRNIVLYQTTRPARWMLTASCEGQIFYYLSCDALQLSWTMERSIAMI